MKRKLFIVFAMAILLLTSTALTAQQVVKGTVTDSDDQSPLPGATVLVKGTSTGTITDVDGKFSLNASSDATLVISYVGYNTFEVKVDGQSTIGVKLTSERLEEVVVVGTRTAPRSDGDTPLPIDVISSKDLVVTGQTTFDKALQYTIPSFNTVQTPVNDATSLLDPYEIRNMGPSRTLILINGKRKNLSSLLYTQTSPGRGETGADISAIPTDAIKRVEVLRDGASAQYGSDAIAGVVNIVLKDNVEEGAVTFRGGITGEGDGEYYGIALTDGLNVGKGKGFLNYTLDFSKTELANRPGTVSAEGEFADFVAVDPTSFSSYVNDDNTLGGVDVEDFADNDAIENYFNTTYVGSADYNAKLAAINQGNIAGREMVDEFLARSPDAGNINGSPETTAAKFLINAGISISDNAELYANAAYVYKKVNSFANYRTPYWRQQNDIFNPVNANGDAAIAGWRGSGFFPYLANFFPGANPNTGGGYDGYVPTFDGDLADYNATLGIRGESENGWNTDASLTVGGNRQTYLIRNSHNRNFVYSPSTWLDSNGNGTVDDGEIAEGSLLYRENSPIIFDAGGTQFSHVVGNLDISKAVSSNVSIAFGSEFRSETFEVIEGSLSSYDGGGADSFAGNRPENSGKFNRYNVGAYFDVAYDITPDFLVNGTVRGENYSDFGSTFVWKVSSRYKVGSLATIRGSVSTGFRAPTLHQIYTQKAQYSFVPGAGIQVGGLVNNVSPQANLLNIPQLDAEESTNFTAGVAFKPANNFSLTVDYYNIKVEDRIVLGTEISGTEAGDTPLDQLLTENNLSDISFFSNAIDTRTTGLDVVASYSDLGLGLGLLSFNLSGNITLSNERIGEVNNPELVVSAGQSVVNETQEALFFTSRPEMKWILGTTYELGKFYFSLNNTYFGKTIFKQQGMSSDLRTEFLPKIVTDLGINYNATDKITIALNLNNLFNVLPEWEFVAENAEGQALLESTAITATGLTAIQNQSNLITFNQRYSQMTYDGYHFSQLGSLYNLSVRVSL